MHASQPLSQTGESEIKDIRRRVQAFHERVNVVCWRVNAERYSRIFFRVCVNPLPWKSILTELMLQDKAND